MHGYMVGGYLTGPVRVLLLFVLHVPFRFGADVCCAAASVDAATAAAREYRIFLSPLNCHNNLPLVGSSDYGVVVSRGVLGMAVAQMLLV